MRVEIDYETGQSRRFTFGPESVRSDCAFCGNGRVLVTITDRDAERARREGRPVKAELDLDAAFVRWLQAKLSSPPEGGRASADIDLVVVTSSQCEFKLREVEPGS